MAYDSKEDRVTLIHKSLREIHECEFIPMDTYQELVRQKKLVHPKVFEDDRAFQGKYPTHPLALQNRSKRIKLADLIRNTSKELNEVLPEQILELMHITLFDCCAAVRHSLSHALFFCGSRRSAFFLGKLIEDDGESKMVRRYARVARDRCMARENSPLHDNKNRVILLISNNIDLAATLSGLADKESALLYMPEPNYTELMAWTSEVQIIDRSLMGRENWEDFCDYLDEVNETETVYPVRDEDGTIIVEEPHFDYTPLIIIDYHMSKSLREFREPNKPKEKVFYLEGGPDDVVAKLVEYILKGKQIDVHELNAEINGERDGY